MDLLQIFLRLLLSSVCGAAIGIERTKRQKDAGIRTHCIIAISAALFMIISKYGFADMEDIPDTARIAAQIVSGIGFIGAGVIFRDGNSLKGLSTATGIWATAGIGMAIGAGMIFTGILCTALTLLVQVVFHFVLVGNDAYSDRLITISFDPASGEIEKKLDEEVKKKMIKITGRRIEREEDGLKCTVRIVTRRKFDEDRLIEELTDNPDVKLIDME